MINPWEIVFVALVGACSAFLFNVLFWVTQKYYDRRRRFLDNAESVISKLSDTSMNYWLMDCRNDENVEMMRSELYIKQYLKIILRNNKILKRDFKKFYIFHRPEFDRLDEFHSSFYDEFTGAGFESRDRKPDKHKASKAASACEMAILEIKRM